MRTRILAVLAAATALIGSTSCDSTGPGTGFISLELKDAPGDVVKAVVTIDQIYLQGGNEGADESTDPAGRIVLRDEDVTVDLLTLADETMGLVDVAEVPNGTYPQLRFVVTGAYIEVETAQGTEIYASSPTYAGLPAGATVTGMLILPSWSSSGLKVKLPGDAIQVVGNQTVLVVDFDVAQSFGKQPGQSGNWVMSPVIEATPPPSS